MKDLSNWTQEAQDRGKQVIILANANQTLTENTEKYSLRQMTIDCDLISTMEARHPGVSKNQPRKDQKL